MESRSALQMAVVEKYALHLSAISSRWWRCHKCFLRSYPVAHLPWAHIESSLSHYVNRCSCVVKMITTSWDAWVESFIEEPTLSMVILGQLTLKGIVFSLKQATHVLWIHPQLSQSLFQVATTRVQWDQT